MQLWLIIVIAVAALGIIAWLMFRPKKTENSSASTQTQPGAMPQGWTPTL